MIRLTIVCLASLLITLPILAESRIATANPTATPPEVVSWTAGVAYSYDGSGNIRQIGKDRFVYDKTGRLVQAEINGVTRVYTYDAFGNRTGCTHEPGTTEETDCQFGVEIDSASNRMNDVEYDDAGNAETLAGHRYTYDDDNMPKRDDSAFPREFIYTADDERIATYNVGAQWNWTIRDFNGYALREFSSDNAGNWTLKRDYVFRDALLLATRHIADGKSVTYHYHLDHLGSPRRITDQNNRVVGFHDYFPFGPEVSGGLTEAFASSLRYTGHERDMIGSFEGLDTLDYMHARYYSPMVGRFLGVDVELGQAGEPQTLNRYAYASNNPLKYIDPDGNKKTIFERAADATERAGQRLRNLGARLNNGSVASAVLDGTLATVGDVVGGSGDMLRVGVATGEAIGSGADGHDLTIAISKDAGRAGAIILTVAVPANGWIEGRAAAGLTAGTNAGRCVQCAKAFIAENPGATPIRAANYNHWAAKTADGKKIFDPTLRDNLKATGNKYRDINPWQEYFSPKEWERLTQRFEEKAACVLLPSCR